MADWFRIGECFACVPNKSGATSFHRAILNGRDGSLQDLARSEGFGPYTVEEVNRLDYYLPRYLVIRHPVSRFESLYRMIHDPKFYKHGVGNYGNHVLREKNPDELMDFLETYASLNMHWQRQSDLEADGCQPILLPALFQKLGLRARHDNKGQGESPPYLPEERIIAFYSRDLELWRRALLDYQGNTVAA